MFEIIIVANCDNDNENIRINKYHEMMKYSFTKPGIMIGFKDISQYIYNNFFEGIAIHHPTSILNSDIIRDKLHEPPITLRCFVKINADTWLWILKTEQTHLKFDGKTWDIKNVTDINEFWRLVMLPFLGNKEIKFEWLVQIHGMRLKEIDNDGGLYFNLNDNDILHQCYFNSQMERVDVHTGERENGNWLKGVYKDNNKWEFNSNNIKMCPGINENLLSYNTDLWFLSLNRFQNENKILVFLIPTQISYDGCQYSQKGAMSINMFARPLSPIVTQMPSFNLSINLKKQISTQMSVINYHFPPTNDFLTNRKYYAVHRAFINDDLIHPCGRKWVDIYMEESQKPFTNLTETQKKLFPHGRHVTRWNFNKLVKGIVADCCFVYYLPSIILDDADRYVAIGGMGSTAIANMKYGFNRSFTFNTLDSYLCHYQNNLNDKVNTFFCSFFLRFFLLLVVYFVPILP